MTANIAAPSDRNASAAPDSLLARLEVEANRSYLDFDSAREYRGFPTRFSVPLPQGACAADQALELRDADGRSLPSTARPFVFWPDGSVRVWELWFPLHLARDRKMRLEVHRGSAAPRDALPTVSPPVPDRCTVRVALDDGTTLATQISFMAGGAAAPCVQSIHEFTLARDGQTTPLFRGSITRKAWGWYDGSEWEVRLTNYGPAEPLNVRAVTVEVDLQRVIPGAVLGAVPGAIPGAGARYHVRQSALTAKGHPRLVTRSNPLHVIADGSIRVTDAAQLGEDENNYPPYERGGYVLSVSPWLAMSDRQATWTVVVPEALERMPKAWRFEGCRLTVDLHPLHAAPLRWRQGMTLFQRIVLLHAPADAPVEQIESDACAWLRPPIVRVDSDVYRAAGWRIPFRYEPERFPKTEFQFRDSFNFGWSYGTFHYGDQLAGSKGGAPLEPGKKAIARNLEYDFPAVAAKEFARTGVYHLWRLCRDSAHHMMHTDFVAHSDDPWTCGGIPHHCEDHTTGSAYPSHMWAEGLTLYYQLSGDPHARDVFCRVGGFYLKYIRERFDVVQGTAREVGWTLIALAAIYDITREQRYLDGIRKVVDFNLDRGWRAFFPTDACFTVGVAIIGFDRTRQFHRDADTRRFILDLLDWMMTERRDGIGLFEYWRDPEQGAIPYIQTHFPEALNIGYKLSPDGGGLGYLRAAFRLYQIHQAGGPLTVQPRFQVPECGFAAGNYISWLGCLASFAEQGWLDRCQYPEPGEVNRP